MDREGGKRVSKLKNCNVNKLKKRQGLLDKLWEIEGEKKSKEEGCA